MSTLIASLRLFFLSFFLLTASGVSAEPTPGDPGATTEVPVNAAVELPKMQKILDSIKQQVSGETNDSKLITLNDMALELSKDADTLMQGIMPQLTQVQAQLSVLGPAHEAGNTHAAIKETAQVTSKRKNLESQKSKVNDQIRQAEAIKNGSITLSTQIINLRRDALKTQLALNTGSIFSYHFWSPLFNADSDDQQRIKDFCQVLIDTISLSWTPGWRVGTLLWLLAACLVATLGRRYLEQSLAWVGIHLLPEGRLRRSFLAAAIALTSLFAVVLSFNFLELALTRHSDVTDDVRLFADKLVGLSIFCGLIAGLGRAFLSTRRPSWRLPNISDPVARALKPFPPLTAVLVFLFQAIEILNSSVNTSVSTTVFVNGLTALLIGGTALTISFRTNRVRRRMTLAGEQPEARSTLVGLIQMAITLVGVSVMITLAIGYITLARFLSYELIWMGIVMGIFFIFSKLITDSCESFFSTDNAIGKGIQRSLNIDSRHLAQAAALLSGIGKSLLVLGAAIAILNGTFGSATPIELVQKAIEFWGGKGLHQLDVVPAHVVNALLWLVVAIYVMRSVRRWLEFDFLPKTAMDEGMRVSLVTLFTNLGYVLVFLVALSLLGVQWNKLAWIVSALSVGIGFGLQEIVKNFISGLILLTERPVKVGDLISISGIEGDIRRINVRATEIQLTDKSTVIVPNSQLISQNVRNVTMGNAQGVVVIMLTLPLDIDPQLVRELLLDVFTQNERILDTPPPSVTFRELTASGIVLSISGNVASPRYVSGAKSDLLFEILTRLRAEGVGLSSPQTMIVEQKK
ncbi:MAG: Miniconductance mechanosensitive channel MscM [Candidatus Erwinia impunctatus]|nr:Miniconductance mechanosensitive channel MscM [Culicoides impunctatus]